MIGENNAPSLADGVQAEVNATALQYKTWSVDLSEIFTEPDEEKMTYTVAVNDGKAKNAEEKYSYECNESGDHTFVFTAKDPSGLSASYTVNLSVTEVPRASVNTEIDGSLVGGTYCKSIQLTGYEFDSRVTHYAADQHKVTFLLENAEDNASAELEFASTVANSAIKYTIDGEKYKPDAPYILTLENGEKVLNITTSTAADRETQNYQLIFRNRNNKPATTIDSDSDECTVQVSYQFDLSDKFSDADNDPLDYFVSVNGGEKQWIDTTWEYTAGRTGLHEFKFTVSDGFVDSDEYTVTLDAKLSDDVYAAKVVLPENITPSFYVTDSFDGENGDVASDELSSFLVETVEGMTSYMVMIPNNIIQISIRGTSMENEEVINWGGMSVVTKDNDGNAITDDVVLRPAKGVVDTLFDGKAPSADDAKFIIDVIK